MTTTPARHALGWLEGQRDFRTLTDRASRLLALQQDLRSCAAARALVALGLEDDTLLAGTPGAAAAAKLRQLEPSIVAHLAARGWKVRRIRFRPMPAGAVAPAPAPAERAPIPASALAGFAALSSQAASPALKDALEHLLHRRGRR